MSKMLLSPKWPILVIWYAKVDGSQQLKPHPSPPYLQGLDEGSHHERSLLADLHFLSQCARACALCVCVCVHVVCERARMYVYRPALVKLVRGLLGAPGILFACEYTHEGKTDEDERLKTGVGSHGESERYAFHEQTGTCISSHVCICCFKIVLHRLRV